MPQEESPSPCLCESVLVQRKAFAFGPVKEGSLDLLSLEDVGAGKSGCCCFGEMQVGRDSTWH